MSTRFPSLLLAVLILPLPSISAAPGSGTLVKNPYADLDWGQATAWVANFHCHTIMSDGRAAPEVLIGHYADAGYDILAITDHDNYHTTREGEPETIPSKETTWPWTRWIDQQPSRTWEINGVESAAFYPGLGKRGMLAIRGNELTTDPHIISLFNDLGYAERGAQTDDERLSAVEQRGGLSYYAHPSDYIEGGRWQGKIFEPTTAEAVRYFGGHINRYPGSLGIEFRRGADIALLDQLLQAYYREHDIFLIGSDDNHNARPLDPRHSRLTLVFAPELTQEAVIHALRSGHTMVGRLSERYPEIHAITVDAENAVLTVEAGPNDGIVWIKDGEQIHEGASIAYADFNNAVIRFQIKIGRQTFFSQAFYIE